MTVQSIDTPAGPVILRPERDEHRAFRFDLFRVSRPPEWSLVAIAPDMLDKVMRQQFQAQTASYADQFPQARFDIVEQDGAPIGRIVVDREPGSIHIVDQAIVPSRRGLGIGTAIMRSLMAEAAGRGVPVKLEVGDSNDPSLRLYLRLGFTIVRELPMYLNLAWTPPAPGGLAAFRECVHGDPALQARLAEPGHQGAFTALVVAEAAAVGLAVSADEVAEAMRHGHLAWLTCNCEVV